MGPSAHPDDPPRAERWRGRARELLAPESAALDLAVFRATVALVLACSGSVAVAEDWASLPEAARTAPIGVGWLLPSLPVSPELVRGARVLMTLACVTGGIGLFTRASFVLVSLLASYVLLVPQLGGAVFHDHHLLWFSVLLAASPCGDALSVDAWWARGRGEPLPTRGRADGLALRAAWLLVGVIFFFPGVHKLAESGLDWALSDNLRNQMWWKWAQDPSLEPAIRIDRHPLALRAGALAALGFELAFLPFVLSARARPLLVAAALVFHALTDLTMGIDFSVLWACYTVFVPWDAIVRRTRGGRVEGRAREGGVAPVAVTASLLLVGASVAGGAGVMQAYPFACYPTFAGIVPDHMPALEVRIEGRDGSLTGLDRALYQEPGPRGWALAWRLAGAYDEPSAERLDAWWAEVAQREAIRAQLRGARAVRFTRVRISVDPDRRGEVLERAFLHRLPLGP